MIKIKDTFTRRGVTFQKLYENNTFKVYTCTKTHVNGETSHWYEVFKVRVMQPDIYHNDQWERYPCDEDFGSWAWCCSNIKIVEKVLHNKFEEADIQEMLQICLHV